MDTEHFGQSEINSKNNVQFGAKLGEDAISRRTRCTVSV